MLFLEIIIPLLQAFIKSASIERLCPGAEFIGMILKMHGYGTSEKMLFGFEFGPTAGLEPPHATEDNMHVIRQVAAHFVRQATVSDDLFVDRLDMPGGIETDLFAFGKPVEHDAAELGSDVHPFFATHGTFGEIRHFDGVGFAKDITVEPMPHKQFVGKGRDGQPPLFGEEDEGIDVGCMVRQDEVCRRVTK